MRRGWQVLGRLLAVGLLALAAQGCATTDFVTGRKVNNLWDLNEDVRLGGDLFRDLKREAQSKGAPINGDKAQVAKLREMVKRISAVSHLPNLPYEVALIQNDVVNAYALPGGKIAVFEGLYRGKERLVHDDDEMAAVLGHEIAHVTCRHSTEEMTRQMPIELLMMGGAIYAELKGDEDLQSILGGAFAVYQGLFVTRYSRRDEDEADRVGLMYMARAGYDPGAAVRLWEQAVKRRGMELQALNILSTHPTGQHRVDRLREALPEAMKLYEQAKGGAVPQGGSGGVDRRPS